LIALPYYVSGEKGGLGSSARKCLHFWSAGTAFLAFSKANSQTNWMKIDCILQKWLSFHKNNYFITQILPENVKILTWILPEFYLIFYFHSWGGGLHPPHTPVATSLFTCRKHAHLTYNVPFFAKSLWLFSPIKIK
jgi:hypothetical protein